MKKIHTLKSQTVWRLFVANNMRKQDAVVIPISYIIQFYPIIKSKRTSHTKSQIDKKWIILPIMIWIKQRNTNERGKAREELSRVEKK